MPEEAQIQVPITANKKLSKGKLIGVICSIFLIVVLGSGYLFVFAPEAQAKEFVKKTSETFGDISDQVESAYSDFLKIKDQVPLAKSSFDEVATPTTDYNYITKDTQQDIADILQLKQSLDQAQEELANLPRPNKVKQLAQSLEKYYQNLEETLDDLLEHQRLNEALLTAHGYELHENVLKLQDFFSTGGTHQELYEICVNLSTLGKDSLEKTKKIRPDLLK